jgi:hypothetical protein
MTSEQDDAEARRRARANWPVRKSTLREQSEETDPVGPTTEEEAAAPRLDKSSFAVVPLFDDSDEVEYWHTRTPHERLEHMELLRRINYGDQATARLQRVLEVVERPWR